MNSHFVAFAEKNKKIFKEVKKFLLPSLTHKQIYGVKALYC